MDTDTSNVLIALAAIEVKQANLSAQLLEASAREDERIKALVERMDERHAAMVERTEERQRHRERFEMTILECVEDIRDSLRPLEHRVSELESAKKQVIAAGTAGAGVTVTLAGLVAWLVEHVPSWFAPVLIAFVASSCA